MNKQIVYIAHAQVILASILISYSVFSKMPPALLQGEEQVEIGCATVSITDSIEYSKAALQGKALFQGRCVSCHSLFKDMTGPALLPALQGEQWKDRKKLYEWIRNPVAFMEKDAYARQLKERFGSIMLAFPKLTDEEIDKIVLYIEESGRIK